MFISILIVILFISENIKQKQQDFFRRSADIQTSMLLDSLKPPTLRHRCHHETLSASCKGKAALWRACYPKEAIRRSCDVSQVTVDLARIAVRAAHLPKQTRFNN